MIISPKGRASGVCFFWSNSVNAKVIEFDVRTIVVLVHDEFCSWSLIGFYKPPYQAKKHKAWSNLHGLLQSLNNPWMCFGDFNVVMEEAKKEEGKRGSFSSLNFLKDLMSDLGAIDLGYSGNQFTWWNKRWGKGAIRERLDQAIASIQWRMAFPKASVIHPRAVNSDHNPLLMDTNPNEKFIPRLFRFEEMWIRDSRCGGVIKKAWDTKCSGSHFSILYQKQARTTVALKKQNKKVFGHLTPRLKTCLTNLRKFRIWIGLNLIPNGKPTSRENSTSGSDGMRYFVNKNQGICGLNMVIRIPSFSTYQHLFVERGIPLMLFGMMTGIGLLAKRKSEAMWSQSFPNSSSLKLFSSHQTWNS